MTYEPKLISPFTNSGLKKFFKPFIIGSTAFPEITDAYAWRGSVRKREGFNLLGTQPTSPVQGLRNWINPATLGFSLITFSQTKSYFFNALSSTFTDITQLSSGATTFSFGNGPNDYFLASNYQVSLWVTNGLPLVTGTVPGITNRILYLTSNAVNS
jgi:hypothetical protein